MNIQDIIFNLKKSRKYCLLIKSEDDLDTILNADKILIIENGCKSSFKRGFTYLRLNDISNGGRYKVVLYKKFEIGDDVQILSL